MILAIDPGLNGNCAVARLTHDGKGRVELLTVECLPKPKAKYTHGQRLSHFYGLLESTQDVGLVLVEGPSYASKTFKGVHALGHLRGLVHLLSAKVWECECIEVPPRALKKYATGNGNAPKDKMLKAAKLQGYAGTDENEADAWLLACYAMFSPTMPDGTTPGPLHLEVNKTLL